MTLALTAGKFLLAISLRRETFVPLAPRPCLDRAFCSGNHRIRGLNGGGGCAFLAVIGCKKTISTLNRTLSGENVGAMCILVRYYRAPDGGTARGMGYALAIRLLVVNILQLLASKNFFGENLKDTPLTEVRSQCCHCPACGSHSVRSIGPIPPAIVFAGRTLDAPIKGGTLKQCDRCGLGFRYPRLPKAELDTLYQMGRDDTWTTEDWDSRNDWKIARAWIYRRIPTGSVLDLGCFDGSFLSKLGSKYSLYGVEINEPAAQRATEGGVKIIGRDLADINHLSGAFDVVTCFDVIEHMENPMEFIAQCGNLIQKNGYLIMSTGDMNSLSWRLMGSRYWYCVIPEHISFISPQWCQNAALSLDMEIAAIIRFSHGKKTYPVRIKQAATNFVHRLSPRVTEFLREHTAGGLPVRKHPELRNSPPLWNSARDHFAVILKKVSRY